jgi:hypothetical protein
MGLRHRLEKLDYEIGDLRSYCMSEPLEMGGKGEVNKLHIILLKLGIENRPMDVMEEVRLLPASHW